MNDLDRKRYDSALQNAKEGADIAGRSDNRPAMALIGYVLAEIRRSQGQLAEALGAYSSSLAMQEELRDPELGWRILYGRGQVLAAQEKTDDAIASYKEAIRIIEETRAAILEERYRAGYLEDRYQVYVALVELLLKARKPGDALFYSEKLRARAYFDRLGARAGTTEEPATQRQMRELGEQIRKLRQAIQKEYSAPQKERREQAIHSYSVELARAERDYEALQDDARGTNANSPAGSTVPQLADIQRAIPADSALVEYVVGKQMISIVVVTPSSVVGLSVAITSESLSSRTQLLRDLITERRPEWTQPARGLREVLVDPLWSEGRLTNIHQLLIVPDGVLNYLPFAALPTGPHQFLGDNFTIAYLPAAAALMRDREASTGRTLLAMAPGSAHLPYAPAEVQGIGKIFRQHSRVVVGRKATKTLFKQIAGNYDYLHLATHASLNRNAPSLSALELEPDKESDGRLELYEIAGMKLHARLVTLSACETALGKGYFSDTPGGDEFVGITRAFLGAGGRNVLASLWPVNDESTSDLMVKFYRHLLSADGPEALARAQHEIRAIGRFQHPYYWAPFVIVGPAN
jgi:CHAT domain-containing protein